MFIRRITVKKDGKQHLYWALVESYRTEKGVRQRVVSYLGDKGLPRGRGLQREAQRCESYQQDFLSPDELPQRVEIQTGKTRTERKREFGGVWLGNKLFDLLGLDALFDEAISQDRGGVAWSKVAKILVLSRFCSPSSELHIAEHGYERTAMEDLLGVRASAVHENRLYRGLDHLLPHKDAIQKHLKERLGTLFDISYDLFLYDVTSTYFEGQMAGSTLAQRGYSRDSRGDCKQVCIALVVTREGLPLGYEVFAGNTHDSATVQEIVEKMEAQYGAAQRIWVMDRGMVSEENLAFLRKSNRRYIIGTPKSSLRKFEQQMVEHDWREVHQGVEVKLCASTEGSEEVFILCRSKDRASKEKAMHDRFSVRMEEGISKLEATCQRRTGDIVGLIERRIGRLMQQNSRACALFNLSVRYDQDSDKTVLSVERKDSMQNWARQSEGYYLLRSNITDWEPQQLWTAYIHLTDAEEAFHIHKSDLSIRPVWHQKDKRIQAHIMVCFLSFVLWKTFGQLCKQAGLGDEPRKVFEELKTIAMVDVVLCTTEGQELKLRTVARPDRAIQLLLHKLGLSLPERLSKLKM